MFVDKEYILKSLKLYQAERAPKGWNDAIQRAIEVVEDAPSIDVKRGRWVRDEWGELYCSECGRYTEDRHDKMSEYEGMKCIALVPPNFCGYCGAYMRGE